LLVALVKPTFELHSGHLADRPEEISAAVAHAKQSMRGNGWEPSGEVASPVAGSRGAIEVLVLAKRGATSAGKVIV
jgi:predicted rRNA methylase YqxC with S4 and FtsJ domains